MHPENLTPVVVGAIACAASVVWIVVYQVVDRRERRRQQRADEAKARVLGNFTTRWDG